MEGIIRKLDFALARCKHLEWKNRLIAALDGRDSLTEAQVSSPRSCELGKWLYSHALEQYASVPCIRELEQVHAELHAIAGRVLQRKDAGDTAGAHDEFCNLDQISDRVLALLRDVERQV